MFTNLTILSDAQAMARHAATRQSVVAENLANANTPGYKSRDMVSFQDVMANRSTKIAMAASRPGHIGSGSDPAAARIFADNSAETSPDGNSVAVEEEILKSIEAERQHSRAITIYQSSLNILRSSIGRGR
jgi:flagellar basal-body rod protein FlgB